MRVVRQVKIFLLQFFQALSEGEINELNLQTRIQSFNKTNIAFSGSSLNFFYLLIYVRDKGFSSKSANQKDINPVSINNNVIWLVL